MNTVVRELPPGKLAKARSYRVRETDFVSGYMDFTFRRPSIRRGSCCDRGPLHNTLEDWRDVATELRRIFAHREMPELLHNDDFGTVDSSCRAHRILGRAGEIILAGQQEQRAPAGVDRGNPPAQIAVNPVEIQIALEDAGPTLLVAPQRFPPRGVRALRRDQARDQRRADFAAVNIGTVQPGGVVPWRLKVGGFEPDQRLESGGMVDSKIENDAAADRTSHQHRRG